ncbi:PLK1 [Lepeophtheirus salmonis]|uniref:PLK1 n=2 Tax=Lepeophtheirus salmonis TaxID=72036 RepID=A0A7R8H592_LEPSM|nr:PLK1 [Lepeophtheirus salmonis]CAF2860040.1 PLK1 [Lepeophtheirus salmonis]
MIQCILQLQIVLILIFIHFYEGEALDEKLTKAITERYVSEIIGALTKNESKMDHLRSETKLFINPKSLLLKENYHESKAMQIFLKKHVIHLSEKQVDLNEFSLFQEVIM